MKRAAVLLFLMSLATGAFAACPDVANSAGYVRIGAGGSNNGTNWTNAFTSIPASPVRGCTYYLASGSYGGYSLSTANSGTTLITIKAATIASHGIATGWSDAFAGQAVFAGIERITDHWVIDGAVGGGPGDWLCTTCGIKIQMVVAGGQDHAFGDSGSTTITDITLIHVDIQGRGRAYAGGDTDLIFFLNHAYNGFTVDHSYLHDTDRTMLLTWPNAGNGMTIQYSFFARNGVAEHREVWSYGPDSNVIVRYNIFEDIFGTGVLAAVNNTGTSNHFYMYGNLIEWSGNFNDGNLNTGIIVVDQAGCPTDCIIAADYLFANNTIANLPTNSFTSGLDIEGITGSPGALCYNNIWYNNRATPAGSGGNGGSGCTGGEAGTITIGDYGWFFNNTINSTSGAHDIIGTSTPFNAGSNALFPNGNYTLKASIPGTAQTLYSVDMFGNAFAPNWDRGALAFQSGAPQVSTPTFSPVAGTYSSTQSVTISTSTGGATLCYTTDGSTPTANGAGTCTHGTTYSTPVSVAASETIKAVGSLSGDTDSAVGSAAYVISNQAASPSFSPGSGTYIGSQSVTITSSSGGAIICYNTAGSPATNGTTGCTTGTLYSAPVTVSVNSTLFAVAGGTGFTDSTVASANYNFVVPPQNGVGSSLGAISH